MQGVELRDDSLPQFRAKLVEALAPDVAQRVSRSRSRESSPAAGRHSREEGDVKEIQRLRAELKEQKLRIDQLCDAMAALKSKDKP